MADVKSFTFFEYYYTIINDPAYGLTEEQKGQLYKALIEYAFAGEKPEFKGVTRAIFLVLMPKLDASKVKSKNKRNKIKQKSNENQNQIKQKSNKNQSINGIKTKKNNENEKKETQKEKIKLQENERKKENKESLTSISAGTRACEEEDEKTDFSSFSDEELIDWGKGKETDFTDGEETARFFAWCEELERRGKSQSWEGRIVSVDGYIGRLKSHAEIMDELCVSNALKGALSGFLRHCYVNHRLVTNDKLVDIIERLSDQYGTDEEGQVACVERAIRGGFFDVKTARR